MLKFALIGAGRIGQMHANNIFLNPKCCLEYVYDINKENSYIVAEKYNCKIASSPEEAINSNVKAVFIASSTATHIDYILASTKNNKSVICEKPIDLSIERINSCKKELIKNDVLIQIGFQRRFDNSHRSTIEKSKKGEIGNIEKIIITSRDPQPPNKNYIKSSGGIFRDMTIHDFDLINYILGDDKIDEINAYGSTLFSEDIKSVNDFDTAMITMKSKSGVLCHINNSRRACYGYDQRIEIFGSNGMLISDNQRITSVKKYSKNETSSKDLIQYFFIERYDQAYKTQLESFIDSVLNKKPTLVNFDDGRNALIVANAAYESIKKRKNIKIKF